MTVRLVWVDRTLSDLELVDREAWLWWLERMAVDPWQVVVPSVIVLDDDARTITYTTRTRDEAGLIRWTVDADGQRVAAHHDVTVQLEAPALPLPPGYGVVPDPGSFGPVGGGETSPRDARPGDPQDPK